MRTTQGIGTRPTNACTPLSRHASDVWSALGRGGIRVFVGRGVVVCARGQSRGQMRPGMRHVLTPVTAARNLIARCAAQPIEMDGTAADDGGHARKVSDTAVFLQGARRL
ncbi:hypothetical protein HPB50_026131 [Hyalomma asiaticum]|uniref:Uncharacterized protein n=1 Tax=Hyalomma asiaticum TaxID=266040 RepID=A0ACB7S8U8_HYAAI|nr:hypothetical protein HPB50_026131 [Hyalomma asiaticum]